MDIEKFKYCIPEKERSRITNRTLTIWHTLFLYVGEHGQVHSYSRAAEKKVYEAIDEWFEENTLMRHLKRMSESGILERHEITQKYTDFGKAMLPLGIGLLGSAPPAGKFLCYTFKGQEPNMESLRKELL